jgi:succinyl-diaminopimelate desuccinylase
MRKAPDAVELTKHLVRMNTINPPGREEPCARHLGAMLEGFQAKYHSSMPEKGVNAVYKAAHMVTRLERFRFPNSPHGLMGQATLNVGTFHGGLNIDSVPDHADIGIDIRTVPTVDHEELVRLLARELGPEVQLETLMDLEAAHTDPQDPWMQSVFDMMAPMLGEKPAPRVATYFTDAAALNQAYDNPPTVILGPGEPQMAHQTDEYCLVERVEKSVACYEEIMLRWCRT